MSDTDRRLTIDIPDALFEALVAVAREQERTPKQQVRVILREALASQQQPGAPG